jgi:hypothetical protein
MRPCSLQDAFFLASAATVDFLADPFQKKLRFPQVLPTEVTKSPCGKPTVKRFQKCVQTVHQWFHGILDWCGRAGPLIFAAINRLVQTPVSSFVLIAKLDSFN